MRRSATADLVVEGTYRTGHQEHVYIEPNGVIAVPENGGVAVYGSLQCPFYALKALKCLLGANTPIRVVQTETGGGFRRQGGISVDDRRPRGAARAQVRTAGEDHLRPRRGHGGDDEAASVDRAPPHGRDARRAHRRDGRRRRCSTAARTSR